MSRGGARDGAGRPAVDGALRRSQVQVGLTPVLGKYVDKEAGRTGASKAEVIRQLMLAGIKALRGNR
jgi:hypothetical protein